MRNPLAHHDSQDHFLPVKNEQALCYCKHQRNGAQFL